MIQSSNQSFKSSEMTSYEGEFYVLDLNGLIESMVDDDEDELSDDVWPSVLDEPQSEYCKHESQDGRVVLITEFKTIDGQRKAHIIVRGTPERLLLGLLESDTSDPYYIDDFLLTYRVFMPSIDPNDKPPGKADIHLVNGMNQICSTLLSWFDDPSLRSKVIQIVQTWISNYYLDFELVSSESSILNSTTTTTTTSSSTTATNTSSPASQPNISHGQKFLEIFETKLSSISSLSTQLSLLHMTISTKAKQRNITLTRSNRDDEVLNFSIAGGYERGYGIFVSKVDSGSKAETLGLRRGDQILEVNGINFTIISQFKALEVLRSTTHLQLTVKYNPFMFREMSSLPEDSKGKKYSISSALLPNLQTSINTSPNGKTTFQKKNKCQTGITNNSSGTKIKKAIPKFAHFISRHLPNFYSDFETDVLNQCEVDCARPNRDHLPKNTVHRSLSNPDLHSIFTSALMDPPNPDPAPDPQLVIRIFNAANGDSRYLLIHEETTAREVVMVSCREFGLCTQTSVGNKQSSGESGLAKSSLNYALYEVSVVPEANNTIKQRRLPDQMNNLSEKASLLSRYYLKENSNPLLSTGSSSSNNSSNDELAQEILKECPMPINLLSLNSTVIAIELTLHDFNIFRCIEPQSFIYDVFEMRCNIDSIDEKCKKELNEFESLSNKEMFWVINEILNETSVVKRIRLIKYFIKVANICRHLHNYNSLFALLSGLGHGSVQRLKTTWDKLPTKYNKLLKNLQSLMDPSRNMLNYRREINCCDPPIIPFFPIVKKDLTFIHLAHPTIDEQELVNFEKLRMISKEIRNIMNMSSSQYSVGSSYANLLNSHGFSVTSAYANDYSTNNEIMRVPLPPPPPIAAPLSATSIKRMFEESLMRKKVKHYLTQSFANINYDEDALLAKSIELEGGQSGSLQGSTNNCSSSRGSLNINPSPKQPHPSPTLSSASSGSSSGRLKFGAESPQQLRKLLSLSEMEYGRSNHTKNHILAHHNQISRDQRSHFPQILALNNSSTQSHTRSVSEGSSNSFMINSSMPRAISPTKSTVPLPVESSSVTSLRRINQLQQAANALSLQQRVKQASQQQQQQQTSTTLSSQQSHLTHSHSYSHSTPFTYNQQLNNLASHTTYRPRPPDYDEALLRKQKLANLACNTVTRQVVHPTPPQTNNIPVTNNLKKVPMIKNSLQQDDKVSAV